jgi:E3 ubiquitin-protein ligase HUWE1
MVQVMRTMADAATSETLLHLSKIVTESLELTKGVWSIDTSGSKLLPLVDVKRKRQSLRVQCF